MPCWKTSDRNAFLFPKPGTRARQGLLQQGCWAKLMDSDLRREKNDLPDAGFGADARACRLR